MISPRWIRALQFTGFEIVTLIAVECRLDWTALDYMIIYEYS